MIERLKQVEHELWEKAMESYSPHVRALLSNAADRVARAIRILDKEEEEED